jgi:hypothetical protein
MPASRQQPCAKIKSAHDEIARRQGSRMKPSLVAWSGQSKLWGRSPGSSFDYFRLCLAAQGDKGDAGWRLLSCRERYEGVRFISFARYACMPTYARFHSFNYFLDL